MGHLSNRNVVIGVTGGIAAYKSAELVRLLRKAGAAVKVVMTRGATEFITPLTLQALSGEPVHTELLDEQAEAGMGHIELARWADLMLVAPATADVMARLAAGRADDLLTTIVLATPSPVFVAPAMNQQMWANTATAANAQRLRDQGVVMLGPDEGEQACGDIGPGRLLDPDKLVSLLEHHFSHQPLAGKRVVITAGPTREAIDPVRYLSNHSSGKMGFALARAAIAAGANTTLISGPVSLETPEHAHRIDVASAEDMLEAATAEATGCDLFIAAAAVADYRPRDYSAQKRKKSDEEITLTLVKNTDIVSTVAASGARPTLVVGFAAETRDVESYATDKLHRKGLDAIVANDVSRSDIGFNADANAVTVITRAGSLELPTATKQVIADRLLALFAEQLEEKSRSARPMAGVEVGGEVR